MFKKHSQMKNNLKIQRRIQMIQKMKLKMQYKIKKMKNNKNKKRFVNLKRKAKNKKVRIKMNKLQIMKAMKVMALYDYFINK